MHRSLEMSFYSDVIGILGAFVLLGAFFALQKGMLQDDAPAYHVWNMIGAICIIISLIFSFNLPSMVLEIIWLFIAIWGVWKTHHA